MNKRSAVLAAVAALGVIALVIVLMSPEPGPPAGLPLRHEITGAVAGVTNCYELNGVRTWRSGDRTGDLELVARRAEGSPQLLLETRLTANKSLLLWLMTYDVQRVVQGTTELKSLRFFAVGERDSRVLVKSVLPLPDTLTFHIDTSDYRIVNTER
jgi:hypothetical protein